ncbi:MAG: hypothetical protein ACRDPR_11430, partial [Nocardioidaceae bacterium]
ASYASRGEVEPAVTDDVLAALAEAGIAAYAEASDGAGDRSGDRSGDGIADGTGDGIADGTQPTERVRPVRPMDRLYVDEASAERAKAVVARSSEDAEWRSLVEQFNAGDTAEHTWPASEDVDEDEAETETAEKPAVVTADEADEADDEPPARAAKDPHEHYIPPEPPRGPRLDWIGRIAWAGVIGGPLLLVLVALLDLGSSNRVTLIGALGFAGGFLTLVFRMKDRLPADDTPDDGAVV